MEHRLDTRLLQLSSASVHALSVRFGAIDELKGWWSREMPASVTVTESARQLSKDSLAALARVGVFGLEENRSNAYLIPRGFPSAARTDYAETLELVLCNYEKMEFGEQLLLELHANLLSRSPESRKSRGQYRPLADRTLVPVRGRRDATAPAPMAAHLVPGETRAVVEWAASRLGGSAFHPLLTIASFLFEFVWIHPFEQGNARLALILGQLLLLRCGYEQVARVSLDAVVAERWTDCQLALRRGQASRNLPRPDVTRWLNLWLDLISEHGIRARAAAAQSPDESLLSVNQRGVLRLLDRHREITNRAVREALGLPRDTAKQVIRRLVALGRIESFGAGRAVHYRRAARRRD